MRQKATVERARELRHEMSKAERLFWSKVRNRQLGWKVKRQVPLGLYIVDFFIDEAKLVIELDGDQHGREDHLARDMRRDNWLQREGCAVLRFWNNEVFDNLDGVLETVTNELGKLRDGKA